MSRSTLSQEIMNMAARRSISTCFLSLRSNLSKSAKTAYPAFGISWQTAQPAQMTLSDPTSSLQLSNFHTSRVRLDKASQGAKFEIINIQDMNQFKEVVINSKEPVLVDFHATWCGPCRLLTPRLEKVLSEHETPVNLAKVDVDNFQDLAVKYRVQGVPAVFAFKDGLSVDSFVGLQEEDIIAGFVTKLTQ